MQIKLIIEAIWFILPAWLANILLNIYYTKFYLRGKASWDRPLDSGRNFTDGRRIIGDGRTMFSLLIAAATGAFVGLIQQRVFEASLIGLGACVGSCAGSFIKRRLNIKRGDRLVILDQIDFILGALALYLVFNSIEEYIIIYSIILTLIFHPIFCILGHRLNIKEKPW